MKIVKETERIHSYNTSNEKSDKKDDFVIRRILKTSEGAKKYIKEKLDDVSISRDIVYTLETWTRRGHWRRLPNSNEKIFIEETTCSRRLEIAKEKEIHLKL